MRAACSRRRGVMAAFLLASLAGCSGLPVVPTYPDLPPEPQLKVLDGFNLDRPDHMPPRILAEQELPCPDHLQEIDPLTGEGKNDELMRAWIACRGATAQERETRKSWESWEDHEREAQRKARVVGSQEAGT